MPCGPTTVLAEGKAGERQREPRTSHQVLIPYSVRPKVPCQHAITMKTCVTFDVISFKVQRILRISSPPALSGHADGMTRGQHLRSIVSLRHYSLHGGRYGPRFSKPRGDLLSQHDCPKGWPTAPSPFPFLLLSQTLTHRSLGDSGSLTGLHPSTRLPSSSPPVPLGRWTGPWEAGTHSLCSDPSTKGSDSLSGLSARHDGGSCYLSAKNLLISFRNLLCLTGYSGVSPNF